LRAASSLQRRGPTGDTAPFCWWALRVWFIKKVRGLWNSVGFKDVMVVVRSPLSTRTQRTWN